ncbi:hypothetical protein KBT16_21120 [Nostoc sp. CCCryo 231-06]|nr:hypothetical protein [Nostoc sp. CCCryo 231-06]
MSKIATRNRFFNAIIASDRAWSSLPEGVYKQYCYCRPKNLWVRKTTEASLAGFKIKSSWRIMISPLSSV